MAAQPTSDISFQNFFQATLSSDITATSTDIFLDTIPNGTEGFLVIDPDSPTTREIIYYNSKSATKVVCPSVADGRGQDDTTAGPHLQGTTVIMAPIAAYYETLLSLFTTTPQGWTGLAGTFSVASGFNKGNKEFVIDTSTDQTSVLSPGMRFKIGRGTTPPTQCTDLESGSSQYASKSSPSGISFTDDLTLEAWVKLESYPGTGQTIVSRFNGTSGWRMLVNSNGQVNLEGFNGSSSNYSGTYSLPALPLGRWVHVAAVLDMSTFTAAGSPIYYDGVSVPVTVGRGGTNPTALVQAGDLQIGADNGATRPFDGKISDVRVWSAVRTATQIRDNMNQQLVGNETNLVAYYKLNGNFNDSTSSANNLTAQGSAAATDLDNPMKSTEYGLITKVTASQITVFTGTDHNIPNMTLSNPYYSTQKAPFGFPVAKSKWTIRTYFNAFTQQASPSVNQWYNIASVQVSIPIGEWFISARASIYAGCASASTSNYAVAYSALSTSSSSATEATTINKSDGNNTVEHTGVHNIVDYPVSLAAQTIYYLNEKSDISSTSSIGISPGASGTILEAVSAYI